MKHLASTSKRMPVRAVDCGEDTLCGGFLRKFMEPMEADMKCVEKGKCE